LKKKKIKKMIFEGENDMMKKNVRLEIIMSFRMGDYALKGD